MEETAHDNEEANNNDQETGEDEDQEEDKEPEEEETIKLKVSGEQELLKNNSWKEENLSEIDDKGKKKSTGVNMRKKSSVALESKPCIRLVGGREMAGTMVRSRM